MQLGKKDGVIDLYFEDMPDEELFLKIRDDLLHSRTGINLETQLSGTEVFYRGLFVRKESKEHRSEGKILCARQSSENYFKRKVSGGSL